MPPLSNRARKFRRGVRALCAAALVALAGLSCARSVTHVVDPGDQPSTMTAVVNGAAWAATLTDATLKDGSITILASANPATPDEVSVNIRMVVDAAGPQYLIAGARTVEPGAMVFMGTGAAQRAWGTIQPGGSGIITVTSHSANRVAGTFELTASGVTPGEMNAELKVLSGRFDVYVPQQD